MPCKFTLWHSLVNADSEFLRFFYLLNSLLPNGAQKTVKDSDIGERKHSKTTTTTVTVGVRKPNSFSEGTILY